MSKDYDPQEIEKKWQSEWENSDIYKAEDNSNKDKFYTLVEFPYPSGDGLHVGHVRSYTALDVISRKKRMEGKNVLYPIGWDAFGLPTENFAIKTGKNPKVVTKENTDNFRKQLKSLGLSFDWSREINTTDPEYYRWTQWIFLKFLEKGFAYKAKSLINWCPKCKIGLANEEVVNGACERCGTEVEKKEKEQWMLAITKYAERLDKDLDEVDYPERVKIQQRNWIGKSEGAEIEFEIKDSNEKIKVFTTRPDTIFGATYMVLAPEHKLVETLEGKISNLTEVEKYKEETINRSDIDRVAEGKEKTGVKLEGIFAINPANQKEIPVFVADYVLPHYGTGAIMAVPAHDERDYEFAKKYDLEVTEVVIPECIDDRNPPVDGKEYVERRNVQVVVNNPNNGKVVILKWKKHPWVTFPMGGIDDGEDVIEAAKREVYEETGYKNLTNGKILGGVVRSQYFAAHKDENRISYTTLVEFDLENEEKDEISDEEKEIHDIEWVDRKDLTKDLMIHAEMDYWTERMSGKDSVFSGSGVLVNSGEFTGDYSLEAKGRVIDFVGGRKVTTYKLRDWVFSRQRYWGEPIPVVHCDECGVVPVPESELPVKLPEVENYQPTDTGESPLANIPDWVNVDCPKCGGEAKRETDVMPQWAGSSWYYLRYTDPNNSEAFASEDALKYWTPVDWYNGGMEHTTLHLLYSRFWHKFLFDEGLVPTKEPYAKRTSHGMILAEGGEKMSKSKGNVVNPDDIVESFGADTLRLYEMFMGPFEQAIAWNEDSLVGPRRFIEKVWRLSDSLEDREMSVLAHKTIKKVSEDIETLGFNTAVSSMMIFVNELEKQEKVSKEDYRTLILILAPFAPHVAEELWHKLGNENSVHLEVWPQHDESKMAQQEVLIIVQIDGRKRGEFHASIDIAEQDALNTAKKLPEVEKWINEKEIKKEIYVRGKIVNIVTT